MRRGLALRIEIDEHHLFDGQNAFARDLVAHFRAQRDRRAAEMRRGNAEFDDVALSRRADEIDLRHKLGHDALVVQLRNGVDRGFLVDPAQQAAAEQDVVFQTTKFVNLSYTALEIASGDGFPAYFDDCC